MPIQSKLQEIDAEPKSAVSTDSWLAPRYADFNGSEQRTRAQTDPVKTPVTSALSLKAAASGIKEEPARRGSQTAVRSVRSLGSTTCCWPLAC